MAKPRIFVSSTYYDLKHIRNNIEAFIKSMGYETILFENGEIPFLHTIPIDESCYKEIENSHMQILIIGGRYGSKASNEAEDIVATKDMSKFYEHYNSITKQEYLTAREKGIPIFIFVEKGVYAEYQTYKQNRENKSIKYAHADSVNVFHLLDNIITQRTGNFIKDFENFDDIMDWLKEQWAGLFSDFLSQKSTQIKFKNLSSEIAELKSVNSALKEYTEAIMRAIKPENFDKIIKKEEEKIMISSALRFRKEPMIKYIENHVLTEKFSPIELFHLFNKAKNIEDYLLKLKIEKEKIKLFMEDKGPIAIKDFQKYKSRYFGGEQDLEQDDDQDIGS